MLLQRSMMVWAMAATALLFVAVYAAAATPPAPSAAIESLAPRPAPEPAPSVPMEGLQLDAKTAGLTYRMDVLVAAPHPDDFRFDFARRPGPEAALRLLPVVSTPRTGWALSGRVGPLRWLTPIDGEGEIKLRLWGRVPGQPRTPGMGNLNISLHYTFE